MLQDFSDGRSMTMFYFSIITVLQLQQQHIWSEAPVETKRVLPSTGTQLRWSRGCVLAFGTQDCGFKPGRSRGEKILSTPSFRGEVKPLVPCHRFAACKRSLKRNMEVDILGKNYRLCFLPTQFHLSLLGVSRVARTRRRTGGESGNV